MSDRSSGALLWQHFPMDVKQLPATWAVCATGDAMEDVQTGFASGKHHRETIGLPHLRPMNIDRMGRLNLSDVKYVISDVSPLRLAEGDILFNNTNSPGLVGKTAHVGCTADLAFSNHMTRLRPTAAVDSRFAAAYLHYLWSSRYFRHRCTNHVNQASISSSTLATSVPFIVPPLAEQRRIVAALEEHLSDLDAAVAGLERARANLERYRAAVIAAAIPLGDDPDLDWPVRTLGDVADVQLGKMLSEKSRTGQNARPYLRNINVRWHRIHVRDVLTMDFDERESQKYRLHVGDVMVCEGGEPGRAAVWQEQLPGALYQKALHRVRFRDGAVDPYFFVYRLERDARRGSLAVHFTGSTIKHLPREAFLRYAIGIPPLAEQRSIVAEIERCLSATERADADIVLQLGRATGLRQSILNRAFEGKLVPQDPKDEPAAVLLDRIRRERSAESGAKRRVRRPART